MEGADTQPRAALSTPLSCTEGSSFLERNMEKAQKAEVLGEIKESFANVSAIILADYRGMDVPTVTAIRDQFRKVGCQYRVLKNSLVKIAIKGSALEPMSALLAGPTAVIWSHDSPQAPAKLALQCQKENPAKFQI